MKAILRSLMLLMGVLFTGIGVAPANAEVKEVVVWTDQGTFTRAAETGMYSLYAKAWTSTEFETEMLSCVGGDYASNDFRIKVSAANSRCELWTGVYTLTAPEGYVITKYTLKNATCTSSTTVTLDDGTVYEFDASEGKDVVVEITPATTTSFDVVGSGTVDVNGHVVITIQKAGDTPAKPAQLYGLGFDGVWNPSVASVTVPLGSDGKYTYTFAPEAETWFVFSSTLSTDAENWDGFNAGRLGPDVDGTELADGVTANLNLGYQNAFKIGAGEWTLVVDIDAMTISCTGEAKIDYPEAIYVLGNDGTWDTANASATLAPTGTEGIYEGTITIADAAEGYGYFCLGTALAADWDTFNSNYRLGAESSDLLVADGTTATLHRGWANSFKAAAGKYVLTVDLKALTLTVAAFTLPDYDELRIDTENGVFTRMAEDPNSYYGKFAKAWKSNKYETTMLQTYKEDGETEWPLIFISTVDNNFRTSDGVYTFTAPEGYVISFIDFRDFNPGGCTRYFTDEDGNEYTMKANEVASFKLTGLDAETYSVTLVSARNDANTADVDDAIYVKIKKAGLPDEDDDPGTNPDEPVVFDGIQVTADNGTFNRKDTEPKNIGYNYADSWTYNETGTQMLTAYGTDGETTYTIGCNPSARHISLGAASYTLTAPEGYYIKGYTFGKVNPTADVTVTTAAGAEKVFPANTVTTVTVDGLMDETTSFQVSASMPLQGGLWIQIAEKHIDEEAVRDTLRVDTENGEFSRMSTNPDAFYYKYANEWKSNKYDMTMLKMYKADGETQWPLYFISTADNNFHISDGVLRFFAPEGWLIEQVIIKKAQPEHVQRYFYNEDGDEYIISASTEETDLYIYDLDAQQTDVTFTSATPDSPMTIDDALYIVLKQDPTATDIKDVQPSTLNVQRVYDLQGRQLSNSKLSNGKLPKGLYINNGKKVLVK